MCGTTDLQVLHGVAEQCFETLPCRPLHHKAPHRGAALTGKSVRHSDPGGSLPFHIRIRQHQQRVIATELRLQWFARRPADGRHCPARLLRPGQGHRVHQWVRDQFTDLCRAAINQLDQVAGQAARAQQHKQMAGNIIGLEGRFPDDAVSQHQRGRQLADGNRHRVIPGRDDRHHAMGLVAYRRARFDGFPVRQRQGCLEMAQGPAHLVAGITARFTQLMYQQVYQRFPG